MKFGHYLNQRVFFTEEEIEKKKEDVKLQEVSLEVTSTDPNAHLFEQATKVHEAEEEKKVSLVDDSADEDRPQIRYKRTVYTMAEVKKSQARIRSYPPVLLHTLFHEDPKHEKFRVYEFSSLYFFGDEIKSMGNEAY